MSDKEEELDLYGGKTRSEVDNDIKVSKYRLDSECEMSASIYDYYAELEADAKTAQNTAEDDLKALEGERELFYRDEKNFPENLKFTEAAVKALLAQDEVLRRQRALVVACKHRARKLDGVVRSLEHKKNSLDNLTVLWSKAYYAQPDGGKVWNGNDEAQLEGRKSLNRKNNNNQ